MVVALVGLLGLVGRETKPDCPNSAGLPYVLLLLPSTYYLHLGISLLNARNRRTKAGAAHTKDGGVADDAKSCLCQPTEAFS